MHAAHDERGARPPARSWALGGVAALVLAVLVAAAAWDATHARADVDPEPTPAETTVSVTLKVLDRHEEPVPDADVDVGSDEATVTPTNATEGTSFEVTGEPDDVVTFDVFTDRGSAEATFDVAELEDLDDPVEITVEPDAWGTVVDPDGNGVGDVTVSAWSGTDHMSRRGPADRITTSDTGGRWELHRGSRIDDALVVVAVGAAIEAEQRALPDAAEAGGEVELRWVPAIDVTLAGVAHPESRSLEAYTLTFEDEAGGGVEVAPSPFVEPDPRGATRGELSLPDAFDGTFVEAFAIDERAARATLRGPQGATATIGLEPSPEWEPGQGADVSLAAAAVELRDTDGGAPVDGDVELAIQLDPAAEGELTTIVDAATSDGQAVGLVDASDRGGNLPAADELTDARVTVSAEGYAPVDDAIELPTGANLPGGDGTVPYGPVTSEALTVDLTPESDPAPAPDPEPEPGPEPQLGGAGVTVTDDRGAPLTGATVALTDGDGVLAEKATDGDGLAVFADLPAGGYTVTASATAHEPATSSDLTVAAEAEASLTLALARLAGSLEVTVVDAGSGAALDGAVLVVAPDEASADPAEADPLELVTDMGEARADGLPAGAYRVRLDADGYEPVHAGAVIEPAATATVRLESVGDPTALVVDVTDTDGAPVPGAEITATATVDTVITLAETRTVTLQGETDAEGRADLGAAPPGEYRVTATRDGFRSWQGAHTLVPAAASPVTARLEPDAAPPAEPEPPPEPAPDRGAADDAPDPEPDTAPVEDDTAVLAAPEDDTAGLTGPEATAPDTGGPATAAAADADPGGTPVPAPAAERLAGGLPPSIDGPDTLHEPGAAPRDGGTSAAGEPDTAPGPAPESTEVLLANAVGAFGSSLPTIAHGPANPARVAANTALAALLAFLLILPAELFNATLRENYDSVVGRLGRARDAGRTLLDRVAAVVPRARLVGGATLTIVVAAAASALDPRFGGGVGSLRLMAAQTVGLVVTTYAVSAIALLAARRRGTAASMAFRPAALLVVVVVVLVSRTVDLSPGFLYGFVAAAVFHERITVAQLGRITLLQGVFMVGAGVGAWLLLAPAQLAAAAGGFLPALAAEALTAVSVGALTSLVLAFVPLTFTHGERLFAWSRPAWLAVYGAGLLAFLSIAVNPVFGQLSATRSLSVAIGAYAAFALGSIAFWLAFRRRADAPHERLTRPVGRPPS